MKGDSEGLKLVLLGKTGAGKSAAGNTILGRQAFKSEKCATSVTKNVVEESGSVCGFPVTVYDTPGLCDPELEEREIQQKYQSVFQKCSSELSAFFIVIKADRFTKEERETLEKFEKLLGQNRLLKTWILFTRGDELEDEKKSIKQFINETEPLKKLVQKYDRRYHVFNNKKKGPSDQVKMLLTKIFKTCLHTVVHGGSKLKRTAVKIHRPKQSPVSSIPPRRIVLLGKTGVGKSAAGNTILGRKKFKSLRKMRSVTSESSEKHGTVSGRSVSVVDTPGFFDTEMNPEELMTEIAKSVYLSSPGPHAFLIVLRVDDRFTEQEQKIPEMIEMLFGEGVLKYSIILFTHGDQLEDETMEEVIEESQPLRDLVDQCGGRFHVFNNKAQNNREQVNDLLQKIDSMIEQNEEEHYTNQMYEDANRFRREEEEQRLREEEERKQQEENQKQEQIERVINETEKRTKAELLAQLNSKQESKQKLAETSSGLKQFLHKYRKWFYIGIAAGVVIGAIAGGAVAGVAVAGALACCGVTGVVISGGVIVGGVAGGVAALINNCFGGDAGENAGGDAGGDACGDAGVDASGDAAGDASGASGVDASGAAGGDAGGDACGYAGVDASGDASGASGVDASGAAGGDASGAAGGDAGGDASGAAGGRAVC